MSTVKSVEKILTIFKSSKAEIRPNFILVGPSGSGKSFTIAEICSRLNLPVIQVNAASLTKEGTAGNSVSKALTPLLQYGNQPVVVFVDEFDKLFISGNSNSDLAHETTNGVQNEFLKALEGNTSVASDFGKFVSTTTDNALFIFAGAFNGESEISLDRLRELGVKTEFLGRVGLVYGLDKPTLEDLKNILSNSSLLEHYLELFVGVNKQKVVTEVMKVIEDSYHENTIGVRIINTLLHQYFIEGSLKKKEVKRTTFQTKLTLSK